MVKPLRRLLTKVRGVLRVPLRRKSTFNVLHPETDEPSDNPVRDRGTDQRLEIHDLPGPLTVEDNVTSSVSEADEAPNSSPRDWPIAPLPEASLIPDIFTHTVPLPPSLRIGPLFRPERSAIVHTSSHLLNSHGTDQAQEIDAVHHVSIVNDNITQIHNEVVSDDDTDRFFFVPDNVDRMSAIYEVYNEEPTDPDTHEPRLEFETHQLYNEDPTGPDTHELLLESENYEVYKEELTNRDTHESLLESNGISHSPSVVETIDPFSRGDICQGALSERAMPNEYLHEYFSVYDAIKARTQEIHGTYETFQHSPRVPIGYSRLLDEHFLPRAEDNDRGIPLCVGPTETALELLKTRYDQSVPSPYDWNKPAIGGYEAGFTYTKQELVRPMEVACRRLGSSFQVAEKVRPRKNAITLYTPCEEPCRGRSARADDFGYSSSIENSLQRDQESADFVFHYQKLEQSGFYAVLPYVVLETKSPGFINNAKWRNWDRDTQATGKSSLVSSVYIFHPMPYGQLTIIFRLANKFECPNFCIYDCLSIIYISFRDLHQPVGSSEEVTKELTVHMACDRVRNRKDPNFYGLPSQDRKKWHRFTVREVLYYALLAGIQRVASTRFRLWPSHTPLRWEPEHHEIEYQSTLNTIYGQPVWDIDGTTNAGYAYLERTGLLREDGTPLVRLMMRPARLAGQNNAPLRMSIPF